MIEKFIRSQIKFCCNITENIVCKETIHLIEFPNIFKDFYNIKH